MLTVARVYDEELANTEAALASNKQILEIEPQNPQALTALENLTLPMIFAGLSADDARDKAAEILSNFFITCREDDTYWKKISDNAIKRVEENYTWKLYAARLMTLSRVYGFWKFVSNLERDETRRYLQMFYGLMFKNLVRDIKN